jgi:hypothetical protein
MQWKQDDGSGYALRLVLWSAVGALIVGLATPRGRSEGVGIPLALIVFLFQTERDDHGRQVSPCLPAPPWPRPARVAFQTRPRRS